MSATTKKPLAVVLASDDNHSFALGVTLLALKQNSPLLFGRAEFFLFTQDISPANRAALQQITPLKFKDFKLPFSSDEIKTIKTYTELTLARYECFLLLDDFKNVLWLDTDILVQGELWGLIQGQQQAAADGAPWGIAMARDNNLFAFNFYKSPGGKYNLEAPNLNAGVLLLDDSLCHYKKIGEWCYKATKKYASLLRFPDQAVLNMAIMHFELQPEVLSVLYNLHPFSSQVIVKKALILHAAGSHKFWNDFPLPQWDKYYKQWLNLGGAAMPPQKINGFALFCFKTKLIIEKIPFLWRIFCFINEKRFEKLNKKFLKKILEK
jgi:lipopolysaccharide biosynthesis glycosyltransferase